MDIKKDKKHYIFFLKVLKAFYLEPNIFFKCCAENKDYETTMYSWINQLCIEERSVDYSVQKIYRARHLLYFMGVETIIMPKKKNDSESNRTPPYIINSLVKPIIINLAS